ncbi:dolichol-phosphate mannosyltransferase [Parabacteroides sp. PFB2-10]|uniref:glycosyltransferase family 2 protein n=1 Tax=Parabacteroides sp. PFB2-10 TaxID=1742405 RepID=UPI0024737889|nr:glycosyltransferase family 2 protein [Parabacteroides sp. PFB2-10]MDH6312026.1 dolichol-phosphate mannosyltransferase [Parabacteroides sp. PFB2-10]MDL2244174.1 glycosyltransferase family 2 protein [Parabacteroides sp. OttesenSCG-928-J18]
MATSIPEKKTPRLLSIIIPSYNESETILPLLEKVCRVNLIDDIAKEIVIVNDGSKDNTENLIKAFMEEHPDLLITYLSHQKNQGKGMAIRTGINHITGDYAIIQDADLEYDPEDYNVILEQLITGEEPVIYGSRFLLKENRHSSQTFFWGGRLVTFVTNILFWQRLTDEPTCYKAFHTHLLKSIPLKCTGFEFCPEVTAKVSKRGYKIKEVPIRYYPRTIHEGKKIRWTDGLEAIWVLLKYRFVN